MPRFAKPNVLLASLCGFLILAAPAWSSARPGDSARLRVQAPARGSSARAPAPARVASSCRPARRWYAATATMRSMPATQELQIRFDLRAKPPGATRFEPVSAAGLGVWQSPTSPPTLGQRPGDVWTVKQPVADLQRGVAYRFRVRFRWIDAGGNVLRQLHRLSRPCEIRAARYA